MATFKVFYINRGYYAQEEFDAFGDALDYGKGRGFEFAVHEGSEVLGGWSPIGGTRHLSQRGLDLVREYERTRRCAVCHELPPACDCEHGPAAARRVR